jgi:hypothetical protein
VCASSSGAIRMKDSTCRNRTMRLRLPASVNPIRRGTKDSVSENSSVGRNAYARARWIEYAVRVAPTGLLSSATVRNYASNSIIKAAALNHVDVN